MAVLVPVAFGVRDEGDGVEASAVELADDEGVREAGRAGDAEAEHGVGEVFGGPAVVLSVGASAEHAKLGGGGRVVAVEVEGDGLDAARELISSPMGRHGVEGPAAGEG